MEPINTTLVRYGADSEALHWFDDDTPDLLPYATLLNNRRGDTGLLPLVAIYEWQESPLVFVVDGSDIQDPELQALRRRLAMRGDAPYLAVVRAGQLVVHELALDARPPSESRLTLDVPEPQTFAHLANLRPGIDPSRRKWIASVVLGLLNESITTLSRLPGVTGDDAISLVGRALFTRFLADRDLLPERLAADGQSNGSALFDTPQTAEATSHWLDETFNGEFLPLRRGLFESLSREGFHTLGNIMRRAPGGQFYFEWREDWAHLDFAQIPVGVLSQAYELYLRDHLPERQKKEGGFYTPAAIAQLMVRGAFHAMRRDGRAHSAHVLDPAAGAGVFLLTAFRHLVAERWRHEGARPDTRTLREILYRQITGFDINESALRFAALGLYLLSIELDPDPEPVEKLRFEDLRQKGVLLKTGEEGSLGSLGDGVEEDHAGRYDLILGNPPWASSTRLAEWPRIAARVQNIFEARVAQPGRLRLLPNEVLDLPFVWRAMEWAKPGAQIAFALHARILFQQHEGMSEARRALFSALDVTGIVNGAELRQTNVWPGVSAPFCLLFARNQVPAPGSAFRFVSPHIESSLNRSGSLRIDTANAVIVTADQVATTPEILKVLFRGGPLDREVFERVRARHVGTLKQYWQAYFGGSGRNLRNAGNGYQTLRDSSPEQEDGGRGISATKLAELEELTAEAMASLWVDRSRLKKFELPRVHRTRDSGIFKGPLLLVHKSPPARAGRIRVGVTDDDLVFSETYYGYSASTHPDGRGLVRYLALLIGSRPAFWYCLVTSGEFGFERDVVEKATIDGILVPSYESLSAASRTEIDQLFNAAAHRDDEEAWAAVDSWAARLYGLDHADLQVIEDTLRYNLPFAENRRAAQRPPTATQVGDFCRTLLQDLEPWARKSGSAVSVVPQSSEGAWPWRVVRIQVGDHAARSANPSAPTGVLALADQLAATEVLYEDGNRESIWVARLAQSRYWSRSAARLLARRIVWEHIDVLTGHVRG